MKKIFYQLVVAATILLNSNASHAQAPDLASAASFVVFATTGALNNTGSSHFTGNVGTDDGAITGFAGNVTGNIYNGDGVTATAASDLAIAYTQLDAATATFFPGVLIGNGQIMTAGVYQTPAATTLNGDLILDAQGDPNAIFVFKIGAALSANADSKVKLINGALSANVFWKVQGLADLAPGVFFRGTLVANGINLVSLDTVEGRLFSINGAINVSGSLVYTPPPADLIYTYIGASAPLDLLTSWLNGSNNPLNFDAGKTFIIKDNATTSISGSIWTVGGTIQLGTPASAPVQLTIAAGKPIAGTINITAATSGNNTLILDDAEVPAFGTLDNTSIVNYNGAVAQVVTVATYGILNIGSLFTKTLAGNISIGTSLQIAAGSSVDAANFTISATATSVNINIDGNIITTNPNGFNSAAGTTIDSTNNPVLTLSSTSKVEYAGTAQNMQALAFNDLTISGGTKTMTGDVSVAGILDLASGTLTIDTNTLTITGNNILRTTGVIDASGIGANITFANTAALLLPAGVFSGNVYDLTQNGTGGVTLGSATNLTNLLTVSAGTITTGGLLTLKSNAVGTAHVGEMAGAIAGNVTVERYISKPAQGVSTGRAWRLVTSPFTGSSNNTVYNNWQNDGINNGTLGAEIWGVGGTGSAGNGLAPGPNSSMRTYNSATNTYAGATNTKTQDLFDNNGNKAFLLFVSGHYGSGYVGYGAAATTLASSGALITGTQAYPVVTSAANQIQLIGNPYACAIDFDKVYNNTGTNNIIRKFWAIDPTQNEVGGYVLVQWNGSSYDVVPVSAQNTYIQSGQGFFVQGSSSAINGQVTVEENDKETSAANNSLNVMRTNGGQMETMYIKLKNAALINIDGALVNCKEVYSQLFNSVEDGAKFLNFNESVYIKNTGKDLAIDGRPLFDNGDTLEIGLAGMRVRDYQLEFNPGNINAPSLVGTLHDNFLNTQTTINLTATTTIPFTVTSNTASGSANRFFVTFSGGIPLNVVYTHVAAIKKGNQVVVTWQVSDQAGIVGYTVERSTDGKIFDKVESSEVNATASYDLTDPAPATGVNYYRIRSSNARGTSVYSQTVNVKFQDKKGTFSVYPNPVLNGRDPHLQVSDLTEGSYTLTVYNTVGKLVATKQIHHNGGALNMRIEINNIATGIYQLGLMNDQGQLLYQEKLVKE